MNEDTKAPAPAELFAQFAPVDDLPKLEYLDADDVPEPFRALLVHDAHMTVTVEKHHHSLVDVHVLKLVHNDPIYSRKIYLTTQETNKRVLFGIVRVNLDDTPPPVRKAIVEAKIPFGRILIEHNVLRRIEPTAYFRVDVGPKQLEWFGLSEPEPMYGRSAYIHCDGKPAVELFEVVVG